METNIHYNYYRDYDPATGRYVQSDPIGLRGGINTYSYGAANPILHFDERGLAYFAKRPLKNTPWLGVASCGREGSPDDRSNTEISHEHLFFEDGKQPANQGYGLHGVFTETKVSGYRCQSRKYDDCLMRKAVSRVTPKPYCLLGKPGQPKYNCQDWAGSVREEYAKLEQDTAAKKECECKK